MLNLLSLPTLRLLFTTAVFLLFKAGSHLITYKLAYLKLWDGMKAGDTAKFLQLTINPLL